MSLAFITGILGQDGLHLTDFLLEQGYSVVGLVRPDADLPKRSRLGVEIIPADLRDGKLIAQLLADLEPTEIYHLASSSFIPDSWSNPRASMEANGSGLFHLLEGMRQNLPQARLFQASSSEMFGQVRESPQNERTPFQPRNPYGCAKTYAHHLLVNYRDHYGLFACNGILFNHEGPYRAPHFVTRKISQTVAQIKLGLASELRLGNLQARRDWGYAGDVVRAIWLMLQQEMPEDFVIGSGEAHSVEEFVEHAFSHVGLDWRQHVVVDPLLYRPVEIGTLVADATKAKRLLDWQPQVTFQELVELMVDADLRMLKEQITLNRAHLR